MNNQQSIINKIWIYQLGKTGVKNFKNSMKYKTYGYKNTGPNKHFNSNVKPGDTICYVYKKKLIYVATFVSQNIREDGPTNEEYQWGEGSWDIEYHYKQLYDVESCNIDVDIKGQLPIRLYNPEKCNTDLINVYNNIVRYSSCRIIE